MIRDHKPEVTAYMFQLMKSAKYNRMSLVLQDVEKAFPEATRSDLMNSVNYIAERLM